MDFEYLHGADMEDYEREDKLYLNLEDVVGEKELVLYDGNELKIKLLFFNDNILVRRIYPNKNTKTEFLSIDFELPQDFKIIYNENGIYFYNVFNNLILNVFFKDHNLIAESISKFGLPCTIYYQEFLNIDEIKFDSIKSIQTDNNIISILHKEEKYVTRNNRECKQLHTISDVLQELKEILISNTSTDEDLISIYDIAKLYNNIMINHEHCKERLKCHGASIIHCSHNKIELEYLNDLYYILKKDGDLWAEPVYFYNLKCLRSKIPNLLFNCGKDLIEVFNDFENFKNLLNNFTKKIHSANANFEIEISQTFLPCDSTIRLFSENKIFELSCKCYKDNNYEYICNSYNGIKLIEGNGDPIFKHVFVLIDDCPEWTKPYLKKIRQKQLDSKKQLSFLKMLKNNIKIVNDEEICKQKNYNKGNGNWGKHKRS